MGRHLCQYFYNAFDERQRKLTRAEMPKPLKPWMSFADQLAQLQQRGMAVDNVPAALDYLERIGYYRLSGYWYPMREIDEAASHAQGRAVRKNTFVPGTRFEDAVRLYVFDKKLRLLALDALERIETSVRVDVAHLLGRKSPSAHEDAACLHGNFTKKVITYGPDIGKTQHQVWLSKHKSLLHRARREPFVEHHLQQYGALPIWVAIEVWDFGLLSKLFAGMQYADQQMIAGLYGAPNGQTFAKWLRSLNFIRNVAAHHSRLWNINVLEWSPLPPVWPAALNNGRPFFYFCLMQQLLKVICPNSSWGFRFKSLLMNDFPLVANQQVSLDDLGVFAGWEGWNLWPQF